MSAAALHLASSSGRSTPHSALARALRRELRRSGVVELAVRHLPDLARAHARAFPRGGNAGALGVKVLAAIDAHPDRSITLIAADIGVDRAAVSRTLADLRELDLVTEDAPLTLTTLGCATLHLHVEQVLAAGDFTGPDGWAELEALIGCGAGAVLRRRLREQGIEPPT